MKCPTPVHLQLSITRCAVQCIFFHAISSLLSSTEVRTASHPISVVVAGKRREDRLRPGRIPSSPVLSNPIREPATVHVTDLYINDRAWRTLIFFLHNSTSMSSTTSDLINRLVSTRVQFFASPVPPPKFPCLLCCGLLEDETTMMK
jgi:hypothetical protein